GAGYLELRVEQVDGHDRVGVGQHRTLNDVQANAAGAEDGDRLARFQLRVVEDDAQARGDGTAEQGGDIRFYAAVDAGEPVLGGHREVAEGRHTAGVDRRAAPLAEELRRGRVDAGPFHPVQDDGIARLDLTYPGPHVGDDAGAFVPEQVRQVRI